jgi:hypothetical protein
MLRCRYSRYISGRGWSKTKLEIKVVLPIGSLPVALVLHDVLAPVHLRYLLSTRGILRRFVLPNSEGNAMYIKTNCSRKYSVQGSAGDPDPHVFRLLGSGSVSQRY